VSAVRAGPNISNSHEKSNPADSAADNKASTCGGLVDVILEIGRERQRIMEAMKVALLRGDDPEALECARELTGLPRKNAATPNRA